MKVFLLHRDQDFEVTPKLNDAVFDAMTSGKPFAVTSARRDQERRGAGAPPNSAPPSHDVLAH